MTKYVTSWNARASNVQKSELAENRVACGGGNFGGTSRKTVSLPHKIVRCSLHRKLHVDRRVDNDPVADRSALKLCFRGNDLPVIESGLSPTTYPESGHGIDTITVGRGNAQLVVSEALPADALAPAGLPWAGMRSLFGVMDDDVVSIAGRGAQLIDWNRTHQCCDICATPTQRDPNERARHCPACKRTSYPLISPAMTCLVTRGEQILFARSVKSPAGRYSALAGFLEAG